MRKVDRSLIQKPIALDNDHCRNHLNEINRNPAVSKVSSDIYKGKTINAEGTKINTVPIALKGLYKNKCAYCEKLCFYPRVEHFRPKGRVIGEQPLFHGYYWLCYEWTNLLPSCHECNSIEAKGDKFPIKGDRKTRFPTSGTPPTFDSDLNRYDSEYLLDEDPYYIHPEYCDNFWIHLDFDRSGKIIGVSEYGLRTISDLKLDDEDRNGWRREIYELHFQSLLRLIRRFKRNEKPISLDTFEEELDDIVLDLVINSVNENLPYTLFRKSLVKKIEFFFVDPLPEIFQQEMKIKLAESILKLI